MTKEESYMKKLDKAIIWPVYFDSTKTRNEGRRVPKTLATPSPRASEVKEAADKLRVKSELVTDAIYPKTPWANTGMVLAHKKEPKEKIIRKIAEEMFNSRRAGLTK
jgi:signal recognition particle subunit SRP19